jgi:hypothetical protein
VACLQVLRLSSEVERVLETLLITEPRLRIQMNWKKLVKTWRNTYVLDSSWWSGGGGQMDTAGPEKEEARSCLGPRDPGTSSVGQRGYH